MGTECGGKKAVLRTAHTLALPPPLPNILKSHSNRCKNAVNIDGGSHRLHRRFEIIPDNRCKITAEIASKIAYVNVPLEFMKLPLK